MDLSNILDAMANDPAEDKLVDDLKPNSEDLISQNNSSDTCECGSIIAKSCELYKAHREVWQDIVKESDEKRKIIENYIAAKKETNEEPKHPEVQYLNENIFGLLNAGLIELLHVSKTQESVTLTEGEPYFDPLNFLAEYLWNMNPSHPERKSNWTNIREVMWGCDCGCF